MRTLLPTSLALLIWINIVSANVTTVPADYPTIQDAIDAAAEGDIVLVDPGVYVESIDYLGKSLCVMSAKGAAQTTLQPSEPGVSAVRIASGETGACLVGFTIQGGSQSHTVELEGSFGAVVAENVFRNNNYSVPYYSWRVVRAGHASIIRGNIFYNNHGVGTIGTFGPFARIENNTLVNERGGISVIGPTQEIYCYNNLLVNCGRAISGYPTETDFNCQWRGLSDTAIGIIGPHDIYADPMFVAQSSHDYRLLPSSPCINAGKPGSAHSDEDGTRNDIGALPLLENNPDYPLASGISLGAEGYKRVLNHTPTFYWYVKDSVPDPRGFEIEVGTDEDWSTAEMWDTGENYTTSRSATYAGTSLLDNCQYYYRIRIFNGKKWGGWTRGLFFMNFVPPPNPLSPLPDGSLAECPTSFQVFAWSAGPGRAVDLEVYADSDLGLLVQNFWLEKPWIDTSSIFSRTIVLDSGQYWWRARVFDGLEYSDWSEEWSFLTPGPCLKLVLEDVKGLRNERLPVNVPLEFNFRFVNHTDQTFIGISNGFRVYTPDGAQWAPANRVDSLCVQPGPFGCIVMQSDTIWYGEFVDPTEYPTLVWQGEDPQILNGGLFIRGFSANGDVSDTVGFSGYGHEGEGTGIFPDFDAVGLRLSIERIHPSSFGKTLCVDSVFFPNVGRWLWSSVNDESVVPFWGGPHCWKIGDCCVGMRGNVDLSDGGDISIADLTALVHQLYVKRLVECPKACNVDGDPNETVDIVDLVYLVDYMFRGGPAPAACP